MLRSVGWLKPNVPGLPVGPIFKGQVSISLTNLRRITFHKTEGLTFMLQMTAET
jgi:hypothetical protein